MYLKNHTVQIKQIKKLNVQKQFNQKNKYFCSILNNFFIVLALNCQTSQQ